MGSITEEKNIDHDNELFFDKIAEENDRNTKLGRRRLIEDMNEKKMLEAELSDFEYS